MADTPTPERLFYIHDTSRGHIGNSMVWWRKNHQGYTPNIRDAHVFKESELPKYLDTDLHAYPVYNVYQNVELHVSQLDVKPIKIGDVAK